MKNGTLVFLALWVTGYTAVFIIVSDYEWLFVVGMAYGAIINALKNRIDN